MQITPFLWFDDNLDEALTLYGAIFPDFTVTSRTDYPEGSPGPAGSLMTAEFTLLGRAFVGLNGGPNYRFTEAFSMFVRVDGQDEVDRLWDALTADGGQEGQCGWCKDKFGLSWQIVPGRLPELLSDPDPARSARAVMAMLDMRKIVIADLEKAADEA